VRGYDGPRQTILVVDDDHVHRDLVCELLEPLGFQRHDGRKWRTCSPRERAPAEPDPARYLDADMDGWTVARRLRQMPRERPAIIMLSAIAMEEERAAEPDQLYDDYMIKRSTCVRCWRNFTPCSTSNGPRETRSLRARRRRPAPRPNPRTRCHHGADPARPRFGHFRGISRDARRDRGRLPDHATSVAELRAIAKLLQSEPVPDGSSRRSGGPMRPREPGDIVARVDDSPVRDRSLAGHPSPAENPVLCLNRQPRGCRRKPMDGGSPIAVEGSAQGAQPSPEIRRQRFTPGVILNGRY